MYLHTPAGREWEKRLYAVRKAPAGQLRAFLKAESTISTHVFLQLFVPLDMLDVALLRRWERGLRALDDLDKYTWGSKQRRAKLDALVADKEILAAMQGAAARGTDVPLVMLALLVIDGSAESIDALLPHLDPALVTADTRLESIKRLSTYAAPTPALQAIFGEVDEILAERAASSPALALGPIIGIGPVTRLTFDVWVSSLELNRNNVPVIQGSIAVDSQSSQWFSVSITRVDPTFGTNFVSDASTSFTANELRRDTLDVGRCNAANLPRWLAATAATLKHALRVGEPRTNLRGVKRARLMAWLRGNA